MAVIQCQFLRFQKAFWLQFLSFVLRTWNAFSAGFALIDWLSQSRTFWPCFMLRIIVVQKGEVLLTELWAFDASVHCVIHLSAASNCNIINNFWAFINAYAARQHRQGVSHSRWIFFLSVYTTLIVGSIQGVLELQNFEYRGSRHTSFRVYNVHSHSTYTISLKYTDYVGELE